jgi:gluconate kinase
MDLQLTTREILGTYLFLKAREHELDPTLKRLAERIEHLLYDVLSIEQFEGLEKLYRDNVDVLPEKE